MIEAFEQYRPLMFSIAYRMLGTASDAEDIVQEAFLRVQSANAQEVQSPKAWLTTVVTRLCLDRLKSAREQRETYIGPWLPEPILTSDEAPDAKAEMKESISIAFLVLLEKLNPVERAVFLLREVFDYDYAEIAQFVDKSESACRQIFHRARQFIRANRPRLAPSKAAHTQLLETFLWALHSGDLNSLTNLLHEDVVSYGDGGGKAFAARTPIVGREKVLRFLLGLRKLAPEGFAASVEEINGWPTFVMRVNGALFSVMSLETDGEQVWAVRSVVNPDKLRNLNLRGLA